jgi:Glucose / Sorbosone dehydrogenase
VRFLRLAGSVALGLFALLFATGSARGLSLEGVGSFVKPVYVTSDPGDADRLFVVERQGVVKEVESGTTAPYLDLTSLVDSSSGERAMASIAFDPDFATSGKLYVAYTAKAGAEQDQGDVVVEELTEPEDLEDPFPRRRVLTIEHDQFDIHNGGQLQFGPDGYLYLSTGDGGFLDPFDAAQDVESPLGKILRFDPDPDPPLGYTAPPDNPFAAGSGSAPIVWALGLRNPFRFSFDRLSGDLVIGDVGQSAREEVDWAPSPGPGAAGGKGGNFGWSCREGGLPGIGVDPSCTGKGPADFVPPVFEYGHVDPKATGALCSGSITGGYVVRDSTLGQLYGRYVYADYCTGAIRSLQLPSNAGGVATDDCPLGLRLPSDRPSSFGEDADGRLYISSLAGGVYRIVGPALEGCPDESTETVTGGTATQAGGGPAAGQKLEPLALRLAIKASRSPDRARNPVSISVSVVPCSREGSRTVLLRRGGKPDGGKRVGAGCEVRFSRWVRRRSTFRALLSPRPGEVLVRSRRLTVGPQ